MKDATAAEEGAVGYANISAQQTIIGNDDLVADLAIVSDVRANHEIVVVTNFCSASFSRTAVNGAVFTDYVLRTNFDAASCGR